MDLWKTAHKVCSKRTDCAAQFTTGPTGSSCGYVDKDITRYARDAFIHIPTALQFFYFFLI